MIQADRQSQPVAAFLGAFDRMNYGDILLPIVLERSFERQLPGKFEFRFYGTIKSDLRAFGGRPTRAIRDLANDRKLPPGSIAVVVGGEVLTQTWAAIHSFLRPRRTLFERFIRRRLGKPVFERFLRQRYAPSLRQPFVVEPRCFSAPVSVAYSSVGGVGLQKCPPWLQLNVHKCLRSAAFVSVRDKSTEKALHDSTASLKCTLAPDAATLIGTLWPMPALEPLLSEEAKQLKSHLGGLKYACFQCSLHHGSAHVGAIVQQLKTLKALHGLELVLLPIGRAYRHDDQVLLQAVQEGLNGSAILPTQNSIYDTMYLIANSSLFIGTSLHGHITAMAYRVPSIALSSVSDKLGNYLSTWYPNDSCPFAELPAFQQPAAAALKLDRGYLNRIAEGVEERSGSNMSQLVRSCE